jgi:CheY-like chemotaxis protein
MAGFGRHGAAALSSCGRSTDGRVRGALKMSSRFKVMVVDDDTTTLLVAEARLKSAGHEVVIRDRAFGTSAAVLQEKPDLVLLDVHMPGLPGDELGELLTNQGTAVILHSGDDETQLSKLVAKTGALGYIRKSETSEGFLTEFRRLGQACVSHR